MVRKGGRPTTKKKPTARRRQAPAGGQAVALSECAKAYFVASVDPWKAESLSLPCVPDGYATKTRKFKTRVRGTAIAGTDGFCMAILKCQGPVDTGGATTQTTATSTYGGGALSTVTNTATSDWLGGHTDTFGEDHRVRTVACALRLHYVGTAQNRGGTLRLFEQPMNDDVKQDTLTSIDQQDRTALLPLTDKSFIVNWKPLRSSDLDFGNDNPDHQIGFCVSGMTPGESVYFEGLAYYEELGKDVANMTNSQSDPVAFAAASAVDLAPGVDGPHRLKRGFKEFLHHVTTGVTAVVSTVAGATKPILSAASDVAAIVNTIRPLLAVAAL